MSRNTGPREAVLILPNQLFQSHPCLAKGRCVFLVEHPAFFTGPEGGLAFHKQKVLLHRASMRWYADRLRRRGYDVSHIEFSEASETKGLIQRLRQSGIISVHMADPFDHALAGRIASQCGHAGIDLHTTESPAFLTSESYVRDFFDRKTHYSMTSFYIAQRKRLNILLDRGKPLGGKWSFDPANRRRLPEGVPVPGLQVPKPNRYAKEAQGYAERVFTHHPGSTETFIYPVTHEDAEAWLDLFLEQRLTDFGDYQDAIRMDRSFLFHSVLTPALNIGLLTPTQVLERTLAHASAPRAKVPFNALEGFIRQVIGWREFMRAVYVLRGEQERSSNFWKHIRRLPGGFYEGTTGILPVDTVIHRLLETGYAHHIERLMILGNFMLLCEIDPNEVYRWFMEMFIDSYDWVMVPNIYGMSQYADGGMIVTKPYISSSNYILKMSNYPRGPWCDIWDALYWRFIHKHRDFFSKNPRLRVMTSYVERMEKERLSRYIDEAERFLDGLGSSRSATDSDG
jgi:deoxyribodipyrimidine photolyase-related protein